MKQQLAQLVNRRGREITLLSLIAGITLLVGFVDPGFWAGGNWRDILVYCAPTAIVACGVMCVVVAGEIDISVGSLMALLAAAMGTMLSTDHWGWSVGWGALATLGLGTLIGLTTGFLVTLGRVPSIIATLGLLTALRGLTTLVMGGENIANLPQGLQRATKQGWLEIPLGIWVAGAVACVTGWLLKRSPLGRRLYAVGSSGYSARMVGISATRVKLFAFAWAGFLTGVATLVDVPRLPKIEAGIGVEFELLVVTCVVVGGVSISGGRGTLAGVLLAVVLMTMVRPVLTFLDVGEYGEKWAKAIHGAFILFAIIGDTVMSRRARRSL